MYFLIILPNYDLSEVETYKKIIEEIMKMIIIKYNQAIHQYTVTHLD